MREELDHILTESFFAEKIKMFTIYIGGSCLGNPGPGGYCAIIIAEDGTQRQIVGTSNHTTNNQMELTAALKALEEFHDRADIEIKSVSQYLVNGMSDWMAGWKARNWKNASNKPVGNKLLWEHLDELARRHRMRWTWTPKNDGDRYHELADRLAREAAEKVAGVLAPVVAR